jgi:hypothetical protein
MFVSNLFNGGIMQELRIDEIAQVSGGTDPLAPIGIVVTSDPGGLKFYPFPNVSFPAPIAPVPVQG